MSFVTDLKVASLLIYPTGGSAASKAAKLFIRYDIKQAKAGKISKTVQKILEEPAKSQFEEVFNEPCSLIPIPSHAPRYKNSLWVPEVICQEMLKAGIGQEVLPCLARTVAVKQSSSTSNVEERPTAIEHFQTIEVESIFASTSRLVLVDDVVTRGATLIGAASHLRKRFPDIEIFAFALARVSSMDLKKISDILSPRIENINFDETNPLQIKRG